MASEQRTRTGGPPAPSVHAIRTSACPPRPTLPGRRVRRTPAHRARDGGRRRLHGQDTLEQHCSHGATTVLDLTTWPPHRLTSPRDPVGLTDIPQRRHAGDRTGGRTRELPGMSEDAVVPHAEGARAAGALTTSRSSWRRRRPDRAVADALVSAALVQSKKVVAHARLRSHLTIMEGRGVAQRQLAEALETNMVVRVRDRGGCRPIIDQWPRSGARLRSRSRSGRQDQRMMWWRDGRSRGRPDGDESRGWRLRIGGGSVSVSFVRPRPVASESHHLPSTSGWPGPAGLVALTSTLGWHRDGGDFGSGCGRGQVGRTNELRGRVDGRSRLGPGLIGTRVAVGGSASGGGPVPVAFSATTGRLESHRW
jgi:hypothetical protein